MWAVERMGRGTIPSYNTAFTIITFRRYSDTWDFSRYATGGGDSDGDRPFRIADMAQMPRFNPGDDFAKAQRGKRSAGAKISIFPFLICHFFISIDEESVGAHLGNTVQLTSVTHRRSMVNDK